MIKFKSLFIGLALGLACLLSPAWSADGVGPVYSVDVFQMDISGLPALPDNLSTDTTIAGVGVLGETGGGVCADVLLNHYQLPQIKRSVVGGSQYKTVLSAVGGLGGYNWRIYDS